MKFVNTASDSSDIHAMKGENEVLASQIDSGMTEEHQEGY